LAQGRSATSGGTLFGDYELLSPIAKGGMGVVYKARQRKLNRIVAVKMILSGHLAEPADIERFYAEAEAAAALSHPNIVAIHEIGEVQGQHFFSMDYIEGQSLAALVQENPLPPRRAAELVRTIAEAVQFAHDNGVIHRDLKPANVLLDRRQRPLITDFGLAKQVRSQSQRTMAGSIMGTPSYMPPEQAAGKTDQIGPWSDLYSLGAILYELLTGRPPFRAASPFETIRQVLDTEPLSPRLLNPGVPKDLETICLKCLQKERTRRYASAQELADELGRFLRGEPIRARPISQAERLWRLCRRNPVTASAIALAVLLLLGTLGVVTVSNIRISAALAESESSFRDAVQVVDDLLTRVSEDVLLTQPGMQPLRKELLEKALGYYQRFVERRGNDPRVQDELANAFYRVGVITEALRSPQEALASYEAARDRQERLVRQRPANPALARRRQEALGTTLTALGAARIKAADLEGARRDLEQAAAIRRELATAHPENPDYQRAWANTLMNLGLVEYHAGNPEAALPQFQQAQQIRQAALRGNPSHAMLRRDLAKGYYNVGHLAAVMGRTSEAEEQFRQAIELLDQLAAQFPQDFEYARMYAVCCRTLGGVLSDERRAERRTWYAQALARLQPLAEKNPEVLDYQKERAAVLLDLFELEATAGNLAEATQALRQAEAIYAPLAARLAADAGLQRDYAVTLRELARLELAAGDRAAAQRHLEQALRIFDELIAANPDNPQLQEHREAARQVHRELGELPVSTADASGRP
jgi:tetratricopeptide (TPR) repeat protein/tRNA A-37 threonylcarbamoyl transferase component Bud32